MSRYEQEYCFENKSNRRDRLTIQAYSFEGAVEGLFQYAKDPYNWEEIDGQYDTQVEILNKLSKG